MNVIRTERKHDQHGNVIQVITWVTGEKTDRVLKVVS